jgi:hypothetical protein
MVWCFMYRPAWNEKVCIWYEWNMVHLVNFLLSTGNKFHSIWLLLTQFLLPDLTPRNLDISWHCWHEFRVVSGFRNQHDHLDFVCVCVCVWGGGCLLLTNVFKFASALYFEFKFPVLFWVVRWITLDVSKACTAYFFRIKTTKRILRGFVNLPNDTPKRPRIS